MVTIYRAESAAARAEREHARAVAKREEDQTAFRKARTLWTLAREEARERAERYRAANAARASAKQAMDAAKKLFEEADRESERTRGEMAEAERAEAESELAKAGGEQIGRARRGDSGGESGSGPFEQGGGKGYEVAQDAFRVMTAGYAEARLDGWYRRLASGDGRARTMAPRTADARGRMCKVINPYW